MCLYSQYLELDISSKHLDFLFYFIFLLIHILKENGHSVYDSGVLNYQYITSVVNMCSLYLYVA